MDLEHQPPEILSLLFESLSLKDFLRLSMVCKYFKEVVEASKTRSVLDLSSVKRNLDQQKIDIFLKRYQHGFIRVVNLESYFKLDDNMMLSICKTFSKTLQELNVKECRKLKLTVDWASYLEVIEHININDCIYLPVSDLISKLPSNSVNTLTKIQMAKVPINNEVLSSLTTKFPLLEFINMEEINSVNSESISIISQNCPKLKSILLTYCSGVDDKALNYLGKNCNHLQTLVMEECHSLSDKGIESLVSQVTDMKLEKLVLEGCFRVSDKSLKLIAKNCPRLRYLNVKGCQCTSSAVDEVLKQFNSKKQLLVIKNGN